MNDDWTKPRPERGRWESHHTPPKTPCTGEAMTRRGKSSEVKIKYGCPVDGEECPHPEVCERNKCARLHERDGVPTQSGTETATPETDALLGPEIWEHARRLERERDALRSDLTAATAMLGSTMSALQLHIEAAEGGMFAKEQQVLAHGHAKDVVDEARDLLSRLNNSEEQG